MEYLELAQNRFYGVIPDDLEGEPPGLENYRVDPERIQAWIEDYVLPAVDEVITFPLFRDYATWPQRHLAPEVDTEKRRLVEMVRDTSRDCARIFESVIRGSQILARQFGLGEEERSHAENAIAERGIPVAFNPNRYFSSRQNVNPSIAVIHELRSIGSVFFGDLVKITDYFSPTANMSIPVEPRVDTYPTQTSDADPPRIEIPLAFYQPALNPSLGTSRMFLVGDHITRAMLARATTEKAILNNARRAIRVAMQQVKNSFPAVERKVKEAWRSFSEAINRLQHQWRSSAEIARRDACITLTQVYAAYHDPADLDWLGLPQAAFEYKDDWRQLVIVSRKHVVETLQRIAAALGGVKKVLQNQPEIDIEISNAIATGGLVIVESRQEVYWEENLIAHDWEAHRLAWKLLYFLAQRARRSSFVGVDDVYDGDEIPSDSAMSSLWNRLKSHLPGTLRGHVVPGPERATYKLELPPERVFLFG